VSLQHEQPVLIIGAGSGGSVLLDIFSREAHIKIVGIVDPNPDALAIKPARELDIEVYTDIETALKKCGSCIVFNMTRAQSPAELAARYVGADNVIGGQGARFFGHIITRLQTMKTELLENQVRLQAVIHNIRESIISINPDGIIEDANPATSTVFGYAVDELIGRNIKMLMPEPDQSQHDSHLLEYKRTGKRHVIGRYREVVGLHKSGKQFPLEINIAEMKLGGHTHFVGIVRDITERKIAEEKLTHLALYDQLTELPNRRNFIDKLEFSLFSARRIESIVALLFVDLDGFKKINDTLGHAMGDHLLSEVARRLLANTRRSDIAARMGGDEFTVILNHLKKVEDASYVAEKIIKAINQPIDLNGTPCNIGASIGIAIYPDHGENINDLINAADNAMYQAKANGKNQCQTWIKLRQFTVAPDSPPSGAGTNRPKFAP
jgi:diguanylate cyclase (GGDEF)-like protein/PAS domain S-box-containing protein